MHPDLTAERVLPAGTGIVSRFAYARPPKLAGPFGNYLLYRLECGRRSTLVLGFIGLPSMGFELESYFCQGHDAEAATSTSSWAALVRFLGRDIVPQPLRDAALLDGATWAALWAWLWPILRCQLAPGVVNTLVVSQLALVGMALLALALFPLTSRHFAGPLGRPLGRVLLVVIRSTPE